MRTTRLTAITAAALFSLSMAACGGSDDSDTGSAPAATPTTNATAEPSASATDMMATFGAGCSDVPTDASNPGSFQAMAMQPVATAASGNPLLKTLVTAVTKAGLVDPLNSADPKTVFAPTNDAFAKIPKADLDKVLADKKTLTDILTYHVVPGKIAPADLAGTHKTLEGKDLTVTGSGTDLTVNGAAAVVCGNVQTANATVYIIDTVLMPKK